MGNTHRNMECNVVSRDNSNISDYEHSSILEETWNFTSSASSYNNTSNFDYPAISEQQQIYIDIEEFFYTKVILVVCIFGIVGNLLNLVVLTRKSLSKHMDRMEKSAHMGLVALASSDLLFCLAALPHSMQDRDQFAYDNIGFWLIYEIYGNAVLNIFIMASTWLTVAMAVSRYVAICYPIKGREYLGATASKIGIILIFAFCVLFNFPRFWMLQYDFVECEGGWYSYYADSGPLQKSQTGEAAYLWAYFLLCILIPLVILAYCNIFLCNALQKSSQMRREHTRGRESSKDSKFIVTLTLSIIVFAYIILVTPSEVLNFTKSRVISSSTWGASYWYNLAGAVCNTLQAINFSGNFILYCLINVHFRKVVRQLFGCRLSGKKLSSSSHLSMGYVSVTGTTVADNRINSFPVASTRL